MGVNRVFLPQEMLDVWLTEERIEVDGETMVLQPEGQRFKLHSALRFVAEVAEGGDELKLVGKVKDLTQVATLGGEHHSTSVILGDNAYDVVEGFVGVPVFEVDPMATGDSLAQAAQAAAGDEAASAGEIDMLAKFFLSGD